MSDKETEIRERLDKAEHGGWVAPWRMCADLRDLLDENARLRAELAERDKDAKRYRWLRDSARSVDFSHWISCTGWVLVNDEKVPIPPRSAYSTHYRINRAQFDAAIDAAIEDKTR